MIRPLVALAAIGLCALLAGCGGPTPFQPAEGGRPGFEAQRLAPDRWRVSFAGNAATPRATVEDYMLYRAAQIALEQGAGRFVVLNRETEPVVSYTGGGVGVGGVYGRRGVFGAGALPMRADPVIRYAASLEMRLLDAASELDGPEVYDAAGLLAGIGPRVVRPPTG